MATNHSKNIRAELHEYLRDQAHWKTIARWLLIGMGVLFLVVWFGRDLIEEIEGAESWIEGHGALGWAVFVGLIIVATSFFLPISILAIAGGTMYGIVGATILTFVGATLTAVLNYIIARSLFRTRIEKMLERRRRLRAIQQAADREGLRLQLLLRMAPINAVSVNYVLGASGVLFSTYLIALVGLLPSIIVNVYFGYTASHVTKVAGKASDHSTLHTLVTIVGLVVCIAVMIGITSLRPKQSRTRKMIRMTKSANCFPLPLRSMHPAMLESGILEKRIPTDNGMEIPRREGRKLPRRPTPPKRLLLYLHFRRTCH